MTIIEHNNINDNDDKNREYREINKIMPILYVTVISFTVRLRYVAIARSHLSVNFPNQRPNLFYTNPPRSD